MANRRTRSGLAAAVFTGLVNSTDAAALDKHAALTNCLSLLNVPTDALGSQVWKQDAAPFNLRLPYKPIAIAVPSTIEQIQDSITCAVQLGVKATPKCGGHSYGAFGLGGEDGHLVIELDRMYDVKLDNDTGVATVQGGARLGHVASELYVQGQRGFSHGTCPGVGVAGHTLHGGFGVSSRTKGLALDAMIGAKMVLANSSVVECSETQNPEIFWALRGAGSSMGVVAEFKFRTFVVPETVTYFAAAVNWKTPERALAGLKAFQDFAESKPPSELNFRFFIARDFANIEGLYWGDQDGLMEALQPLLSATNAKLAFMETGGWLDQALHFGNGLSLDQTHPYDMNANFYSTSVYTKRMSDEQLANFVSYWFNVGKASKRDWYVQMDIHGGASHAINDVPSDATAYAHRGFLFMINLYDAVPQQSTYPSDAFPFLQGFANNITSSLGEGEWGRYINYPDTTLNQTAAQNAYWGQHLSTLQGIKAELDPDNVFHYPQGIMPVKL